MKQLKWLIAVAAATLCSHAQAQAPAGWICDSQGSYCIEIFDQQVDRSQLQQSLEYSDSVEKPILIAHHTKKYRYKNKRKAKRPSYSFPAKRNGTGRKVFIFDPSRIAWAAYDRSGNLVRSGRASGGKHYCADVRRSCLTPRGSFRIYSKGGPGCKSSKYPRPRGGAPMMHCMFFYKGYAIHGSNNVPSHNASHGCIRVRPPAARWLNREFLNHGSTVIVRPY